MENQEKQDISFRINEISKLFFELLREESMHEGLKRAYPMLLRILSFGGGQSQLELTRIANLKPSTISVTLKAMEADGLVKRVVDEDDQRISRVYLTKKGADVNLRTKERIEKLDSRMTTNFSEEELSVLEGFLIRIRENLVDTREELKKYGEEKDEE